MTLGLDIELLILIGVANGTPVFAEKFFGRRFSFPVDCGAMLADGQRVLGASKSIRGLVLSVVMTTAAAAIIGLGWSIGAIIAILAMLGDLCSSFVKRRMKMPASSMALGIDQIPEALFPMLGCASRLPLSAADVAIVVATFFVSELLLSRILFRLRLRNRPY